MDANSELRIPNSEFCLRQREPERLQPRPDDLALLGDHLLRALPADLEEGVQLVAREGLALGGPLDLDEVAVTGEDQVEVDVAVEVLAVVEIGPGLAADQTDRDCGDLIGDAATR